VVNGCRQEVFDDHFLQSARVWEERSKKRWKIDWGEFASLVEEAKAARSVWGALSWACHVRTAICRPDLEGRETVDGRAST
jgi:hypothetical protein